MYRDMLQNDLLGFGPVLLIDLNALEFLQSATFFCTVNDLAKDTVLAIQMWCFLECYEELAGVGTRTFIGHRNYSPAVVSQRWDLDLIFEWASPY